MAPAHRMRQHNGGASLEIRAKSNRDGGLDGNPGFGEAVMLGYQISSLSSQRIGCLYSCLKEINRMHAAPR
jgi:hypothetical protein